MNTNITGSSVMTRQLSLSTYQFQRKRDVCVCVCVFVCMHAREYMQKEPFGAENRVFRSRGQKKAQAGEQGQATRKDSWACPFLWDSVTDNQIGPRSSVEWGNIFPDWDVPPRRALCSSLHLHKRYPKPTTLLQPEPCHLGNISIAAFTLEACLRETKGVQLGK